MTVDIKQAKVLAKQAIMTLTNQLVVPGLVHRDYEEEIGKKGKTIEIIKPATFTANDFNPLTGSVVQDPDEDSIEATLDKWKEVTFQVPDFERTVNDRDFLKDLLEPAMLPIAEEIEKSVLNELVFNTTANNSILGSSVASLTPDIIVDARTQLFKQKAPMSDAKNFHGIISGKDEGALLKTEKFTSSNFTGEPGQAIQEAYMGRRYGFNLFPSQLVPAPTPGDTSGLINFGAGYTAGATTLIVDSFTSGQAPPVGSLVTIGALPEKYTVQPGTTITSLVIYPGLSGAVADNDPIVVLNVNQNPFFHRNAVALAMRPLEKPMDGTGSQCVYVNYKGYGLRMEIYRDHSKKRHIVSFDALWAVKMLNQDLATRVISQP